MKKWICDKCGKELLLEDEIYNVGYKGEKICLECDNKAFSVDCSKSLSGKWILQYLGRHTNFNNTPNETFDFECKTCGNESVVEYSVYTNLYKQSQECLSCMITKQP